VRLFLAGSMLLTLTAACNVSLFLLSRAPGRRRELAIRMAVGALPARIARQLMTESGLLVVTAALLGLVASIWLAVALPSLPFLQRVRWENVTVLDWRVLGIAGAAALLLALLVSLAPVAGLRRVGLEAGSRRVRRVAGWGQRLVGSAQVALATVVGAAAIAFVWHVIVMSLADRGFSATDVYVVRLTPPTNFRLPTLADRESGPAERELRRAVIGSVPGVESVAFTTAVPGLMGMLMMMQAAPSDDPDSTFRIDQFSVEPAYFTLLGINLRHGRVFRADEPDLVVVNETLARRLWGRTDVIGEIIPFQALPQVTPPRAEIVGVIEDVSFAHPNETVPPMAFRLLSTTPAQFDLILIKSALASATLKQMIEQRVDAGEIDLDIALIESIDAVSQAQLAPDRARAMLTAAAAVVVLLLAATGYYGTQHYLVAAGRRDYAILAAVGASPLDIYKRVLWRGLGYGSPGLVLGCVLAFVLVVWLRDNFVTDTVSPLAVTGLVAVGIAALMLVATSAPAREARNLAPAPLLKED
jgi:ABC-type antimicrobial peptide transport system permease subunit